MGERDFLMGVYTHVQAGFSIKRYDNHLTIYWNNNELLHHSEERPFIYIGVGQESIDMYRGNFKITDYVVERIPLRSLEMVTEKDNQLMFRLSPMKGYKPFLTVSLTIENEEVCLEFESNERSINRFWIRICATEEEKVFGCGEQMSYFNLRKRNFPLWTSEPGIGRNKNTYITWMADVTGMAGGDYYHTNYPQPTYVSSYKYYCHVETTAYADFDFRHRQFHELQIWEVPRKIIFEGSRTFVDLVGKISKRFGRQPELPEWTYNGIWLGIQGGTEVVEEKLKKALAKGIKIGAVWCQDWQGKRITSFGKRLMWNWQWNENEYPQLDSKIYEWKEKGIRFLGYINPYLAVEGNLFKEASEKGYLAKNESGSTYLVDFGEFYCGIVDFTNEEAFEWYKNVIKNNLIGFGLDGWMADFGEYLPTDVCLHSGQSAMIMHNAWPVLWAKVNYEAVKESGKLGEVVYFIRAGYSGFQKYCTLLWAGDQSVDWTLDDGLPSVIPAALSAGMSGMGLHHSDIGGYTSLFGNKRSKELLLRWADLAAFTPVMRTHEGNRPDDCVQFDEDDETLGHFARMTQIYVGMAPYTKEIVKENCEKGIPVQRPLFMHYEQDEKVYDIQYQYLYGRDLLVAPVYKENVNVWEVYLPEDEWLHLWTGKEYNGGVVTVSAPIGYPPVFYRKHSKWKKLFEELREI
jgi:sulfoquinovosidase